MTLDRCVLHTHVINAMTGTSETITDDAPLPLVALTDYDPPALPTEEWLRRKWAQARALFEHEAQRPFVAADKLERATLRLLDRVVAPPACGPVIEELSAFIGARETEGLSSTRLTLILVPPCDENDVVGSWARQDGYALLSAPRRPTILGYSDTIGVEGEGLLVIPQLERWFLRHADGLIAIRALLAALETTPRRCVVGCSSWAWAFLSHAVQADLILPEPLTFHPFDSTRLQPWFADLSQSGDEEMRFRLARSGDFLLSGNSDKRVAFFQKLAALSRGIPWVAWHLWRQALRSNEDESVPTADEHEHQQTLWVAALNELVLPGHHPQVAMLVLHTLLIHGPLTRAELRLTLAMEGQEAILASLVRSGFVNRAEDLFRIRTAAYPSIRSGLSSAGFPVVSL